MFILVLKLMFQKLFKENKFKTQTKFLSKKIVVSISNKKQVCSNILTF